MKNKIIMGLKVSAIAGLIITLTGCWNSRELDSLSILMGIGVDTSETPGEIDVTAQIVVPGAIGSPNNGGASTNESKSYFNVTQSDVSIISALRNATKSVSRKLYTAHTQVLVIGKEQAQKTIQPGLDIFLRDHEKRLNMLIVVSETTAAELLDTDVENEILPAVNLEKLLETQIATSEAMSIRIVDFLQATLSKSSSAVAPRIKIEKEDEENSVARVCGMAVFKKDKMVGELCDTLARGFLFSMDKVESGIIVVPYDGGHIQLEIIRSKTKKELVKKDGKFVLKLNIREEGNIAGKVTKEDIPLDVGIQELQKEAERVIKEEIKRAFAYSKEINTDFFRIADLVYKHYPEDWKKIEDDWDDIFKDVELEIKVDSKIRGTGRLTKSPYGQN